jgi:hypothetical protein
VHVSYGAVLDLSSLLRLIYSIVDVKTGEMASGQCGNGIC